MENLCILFSIETKKNEAELMAFQRDLEDRFGPLPLQADDLINSVRLKWKAQGIGLERLILKKGQLSGYFIADQENTYYQSPLFSSVLQWVQLSEGKIELKEKETRQGLRLRLAIKNINTIPEALACFPNL